MANVMLRNSTHQVVRTFLTQEGKFVEVALAPKERLSVDEETFSPQTRQLVEKGILKTKPISD